MFLCSLFLISYIPCILLCYVLLWFVLLSKVAIVCVILHLTLSVLLFTAQLLVFNSFAKFYCFKHSALSNIFISIFLFCCCCFRFIVVFVWLTFFNYLVVYWTIFSIFCVLLLFWMYCVILIFCISLTIYVFFLSVLFLFFTIIQLLFSTCSSSKSFK